MPEVFELSRLGSAQYLAVQDGAPRTVHNGGAEPIIWSDPALTADRFEQSGRIEAGETHTFERPAWLHSAEGTQVVVTP